MKLEFNTKTEVTAKQYNRIMTELKGTCAGRIENDKYYIKVWLRSWIVNIKWILVTEK